MKTEILVFTSCLLITLSSCISVKLAPDYSEAIENQIIEKELIMSVSKEYLEIESNINSIVFQHQSREKSEDFVKMAKLLKDNFIQYKKEHKDKKTLNHGQINLYTSYINGFWRPLLMAEKALKNIKH